MIVTAAQLQHFMSDPKWTETQTLAAAATLAGVEGSLEDRLYGAYISLRPARTETAIVLASGTVDTRQPVNSVTSLNGVAVDDTHPLDAAAWSIYDGRLHSLAQAAVIPSGPVGTLWPGWNGWGSGGSTRTAGTVTLAYIPGWGDVPALRLAILRKAAAIMDNRHDDSILARNTDAQKPPPLVPETFTDDEMAQLGTYRWLTVSG
jgi:hypothetical protein